MQRLRLLVPLALAACSQPTTVVIVALPGADGRETPVAEQVMVLLPYDRDSMTAALTAAWPTPRPDTLPFTTLLDSLRGAYARFVAAPPARRDAARRDMEALRTALEPRIALLRTAQRDWQDSAWRTYDSVTFGLIRRLARDPFADTTDAQGMARVTPPRPGPWWATMTAWDQGDPYTEWYWNVPLTGDTVRLTTANALHRRRY
jgi:hypothetical protein